MTHTAVGTSCCGMKRPPSLLGLSAWMSVSVNVMYKVFSGELLLLLLKKMLVFICTSCMCHVCVVYFVAYWAQYCAQTVKIHFSCFPMLYILL